MTEMEKMQERVAEMQYEAGMYQSLYEESQRQNERLRDRIAELETVMREMIGLARKRRGIRE